MDIVTFLRRHITRDKNAALAAISSQADKGWEVIFSQGIRGCTIAPHVGHIHEEVQAHHVVTWDPWRVIAECEAKEKILELHEQWPVLVERQTAPEPIEWGADNFSFRASRELLWMSEQSYLRTFGERPPTDAIVRAMAHPYRHDPDFNPEWSIQ